MDLALALIFITITKETHLPAKLIDSICWVESKYDTKAVHHDDGATDSLGLCQIKLKTAQWLGFKGTVKDLMKPEINAKYAAKYLSYQYKRYNYNMTKAIIAYNIGNAKDLTRTKYSDKVVKRFKEVSK